MPSTIGIKCPSCGAEPGKPCEREGGMALYCQSRIRAANPRNYDSPCDKCNTLQKTADDRGDEQRQHIFGHVGESKSKWPQADRRMVEKRDEAAKEARDKLAFHKMWEHHEVGTRVERINPQQTLAEMTADLCKPRTSDPSREGIVTGTGYLNGKQTVMVNFDNGTFGDANSYADEFRKLEE